jgi:RNA polymerase sigma factor (sigma-70 family)
MLLMLLIKKNWRNKMTKTVNTRNTVVTNYLNYTKGLVAKFCLRHGLESHKDDLGSVASIALVTAAERYLGRYGDAYEEHNFSVYLNIVINGTLKNYMSREVYPNQHNKLTNDLVDNYDSSSGEVNESSELLKLKVMPTLSGLTKLQDQAIRMTLFDNLTQRQISQILGVTQQAISGAIQRGTVAIIQQQETKETKSRIK